MDRLRGVVIAMIVYLGGIFDKSVSILFPSSMLTFCGNAAGRM